MPHNELQPPSYAPTTGQNDEEPPTTELPVTEPDAPGTADSGAMPTKVCRRCSVQSQTEGNFCPHCAAPYSKPAKSKKRKRLILALIAVLVLGGIGTGAGLVVQHNNEVAAQEAAAEKRAAEAAAAEQREAEAAAEAAEEAAAAKEAQEAEDEAERIYRALVVTSLEESILKDAKERVTAGTLTGPILEASCTPMAGGSTDDLTALTGSYDCIAVNEKHDDGTASGYRFSATTNWDDASYSWHLGG